ncbi:hypothetical protein AABD41_01225 [Staphylococcus pseudoxylosus]
MKILLVHPTLAVLVILGVLKQLKIWHLGYIDRKPNNKNK